MTGHPVTCPTCGRLGQLGPIRARREAVGLSQKQLARRARVDNGHLSRIERGIGKPSPELLHRIAVVLGCEPGDIEPPTPPFTIERASALALVLLRCAAAEEGRSIA